MLKLFSFIQHKGKTQKHEKGCNNHDYCYVEMPDKGNKMLKHYHGKKPLKAPFRIYADLKCLPEKMHSCRNNLQKSYTEKKSKHTPSGYSLFTNCSFNEAKNKLSYYRGKDCIEKFCKDLKELAMRIVNYGKKEMIALTDEEIKFYKEEKVCNICKKGFSIDNDKKHHKVRGHCHYTGKFRGAAS